MQAAARSYASLPHALYHHNAFQAGVQDYELKKQYLALLPPQQIIDICLTFDLHVPPYIKGTVWPPDINAAITALKSSRPSYSNSSENHRKDGNVSIMDSLADREQSPHGKSAAEEQPPPLPANAPTPSEPGSSTSDKESTQPHHPSIHPYTHAAYPHAPYYPPPSAAYSLHLHPPYPGYPPPPGGYPSFHNPLVSHASQDPYGTHASDDLPSYEEMIVEALVESNDPEGCAPKDLFTWMASHYPLQSNFRPSASQALQKAFKRGRFEKTDGGKYRLNATWEGGNTSRRTTRRPQTLSQSAASNTSTLPPPFTQTPLIHHHHHSHHPGVQTPYPGQPYGYSYAPIPSGHPQYSSFGHPPTTAPAPSDGRPLVADKEAKDAYETAQSILRAINFGNLLQMSSDADEAGQANERNCETLKSTVSQTSSATTCAESPSITAPAVSGDGSRVSRGEKPRSGPEANRAQLQAQLALLAAQLAEIAEAREGREAEDVEAVM